MNDPHAIEMIQQIDYDFSKFKKAKGSQIGVAVRSNILDNETLAFIKNILMHLSSIWQPDSILDFIESTMNTSIGSISIYRKL